jgi:PilZ domain-containing protein
MEEKRAKTRFEVSLSARWEGSATNYDVRISDLSEGGCYVDTISEVSVGEILLIKILMPCNEWLDLQGVVAHYSRLGFGVRFLNLDEEQRRSIQSLTVEATPVQ